MKIAFCLHGRLGRLKGKITEGQPLDDLNVPYNQFKEHLFDKNDKVDTFLHIRDLEGEQELLNLYKPKKYFSEEYKDPDTENFLKGSQPIAHQRKCSKAMWSRFYSLLKSVELKKSYEKEHGFKYDCVFVCRYDLLAFEDFIFSNYDMSYFHVPFSIWHMTRMNGFLTEHLPDLWFFSSSDQMDEFANVYLDMERHSKDRTGNCVSPHFAITNKLKEQNAKVRFVLNSDVDSENDITRVALARMRDTKYWGFNKDKNIYFLKEDFKKYLNKSYCDLDWEKTHGLQNWSFYKGKSPEYWYKNKLFT